MGLFVSWMQLKMLFQYCFLCGAQSEIIRVHAKGVVVVLKLECIQIHEVYWSSHSQKRSNNGNIMMAASILLSGLYVIRFIEVMSIENILCFTDRTYNQIQSEVLFPSVNTNYNKHSLEWLDSARNQDCLELVADGRCDSHGFIETYVTYTLVVEEDDGYADIRSDPF